MTQIATTLSDLEDHLLLFETTSVSHVSRNIASINCAISLPMIRKVHTCGL